MTLRPKKPSIQSWVTPWHIFASLDDFMFGATGKVCTLDASADNYNAKCSRFYTLSDNGLAQPWIDGTFYQPPYADQSDWLKKAAREAELGRHSVGLLKYAAAERYWRPIAYERGEQHVYDGRIAFLAPKGGARLETKDGVRFVPEGEPVKGSDFASCAVFLGPRFKPRTCRYRDARTGLLIPAGTPAIEARR